MALCYTIQIIIIVDRLIYYYRDMHFILKRIFIMFAGEHSRGKQKGKPREISNKKEQEKPPILVQHSECSM